MQSAPEKYVGGSELVPSQSRFKSHIAMHGELSHALAERILRGTSTSFSIFIL